MTGKEPSRRRRLLLAVLGLAISAVAIALLLQSVDIAAAAEIVASATVWPLLLALAVMSAQASLRAARWRALVAGAVGRSVPLPPVAMAMFIGYLGNAVLPARLGEAVRAGILGRVLRVPVATVLGTAVLERLVDILVLALVGAVVVALVAVPGWVTGVVAVGVAAAVVGLVVLLGVSRRPGWAQPLSVRLPAIAPAATDLLTGIRGVGRASVLGFAAAMTLAAWCLDAAVFWLVGQSLGLDIAPLEAVLISVVGVLSTAVPSAPGYVGTFELGVVAAAALVGVTGPPALAFAVLAHVTTLLPLALAGAISLVVLQSLHRSSSSPAGQVGAAL